MDYKDLLSYARTITNETLREILEEKKTEAASISNYVKDIAEVAMDYTLRGGKRLRAFLVLIGYWSRKWRSRDIGSVRYIMAGMELLQSYLLVHDDIMDRDEIRRGGPTVHVWFEDKCRKTGLIGDCQHYGVSQAITTGDYLESLAIYSFTRPGFPQPILSRLLETYTRGLRMVSYGQFLDVLIANKRLREVTEKDVYTIHKLKTASYTVELPLHLGAIASGETDAELYRDLSAYAEPAGIAFQLVDDILGLYGDPGVTGKPVGSDVREKKKTLLIVKAYELGGSEDKRFLEEIYDHKKPEDITDNDVAGVQEIVRSTGSLDYNKEVIEKLAEEAYRVLEESSIICSEAKRVLSWLLRLFIERKK